MPRLRSILIGLLVILLVGSFALWRLLQADFFWQWAGRQIVSAADKSLHGSLSVDDIQGNPINGLFFQGVTVSLPDGEVLTLKSLEVRFSLWSLLRLQPVFGKLALVEPRLNLEQDDAGRWNVSRLMPPEEEEPAERGFFLPLRAVHFRQILVVDGDIHLRQPGSETRFQNLDLDAALTLLHPLTPRQTLQIPRAQGAVTAPQGRFALETSLTWGEDRLELESFHLKGNGEPLLSVGGTADLAGDEGRIDLRGEAGPLPGKILRRFWDGWPEAWDLRGSIKLGGSLTRLQLDLEGAVHQAPYTGTGVLEYREGKWRYRADLALKEVPPKMLAAFEAPWAEQAARDLSPLSLRLRAEGVGLAWPPERFATALEVQPFTYAEARVEHFKAELAGDARRQNLDAALRGNFGSLSLTGVGSFLTAPAGELKLQTESFRPQRLGLAAPECTVITGRFTGSFSLPDFGDLDRLKVAGALEASGAMGGHPIRELKGRLAWEKPNLEIPQLQVHLGNVRAELKGTLAGDKLDFAFKGRTTPDGDWPVPAALEGHLTWEGTLAGRLADPAFSLRASGQALAYETYSIRSFTLAARGEGWPLRAGAIDFQGRELKTPAGVFSQATLEARGEAARWTFSLNAANHKSPQLELTGSADLSERPLEVTLDLLRFRFQEISGQNRTPVRFRFLPGFEVEPATFAVNEGSVTLEALIRDAEVAGRLEAADLPAQITGVADLTGKLHARLSLEGRAVSPVIQGEIRLEPGRWGDLSFTAVRTDLDYRNTTLRVNGHLEERATGGRLQWEGRLPLLLSLSPARFDLLDEDLQVRFQGERLNLSMLTLFTEEVEEAAAPIAVTAEMTGRLSDPRITGEVRWEAGHIKLRQAGARYRLQPGVMTLRENRLSLPQLTLISRGDATLRGDVTLVGLKPEEVRVRLVFNNFKALDRLRSEAFVSGDISVDGPWMALAVVGRLTIPRATLTPELLRLGAEMEPHKDITLMCKQEEVPSPETPALALAELGFMQGMKIALTVDARDNVVVQDKLGEVELSLQLRIRKQPDGPIIVGGMARSIRGNVNIRGREFKVVKVLVDLPGDPRLKPYIEARAEHEMRDVTIFVDVSGPLDNPRVDLASDPMLPKSEILSYLVFGRPSETLSSEEFSAGKLAAGALGGFTAEKIGEILGDDFPLLGGATLKSSPGTLGLIKPISRGVSLSLERRADTLEREAAAQVRLQYRVNRNITLEGTKGRLNTGGDIFFNYDF
jgi:autotransporter translocation and assembly factor TamB